MNPCHCNYCGSVLSLPSDLAVPNSVQEQIMISGIQKNDCLGCGATVRERQLKFYFDEVKLLQGRYHMRILHFNPEPRFLSYLANLKPELHILAMAETADHRYEVINIESIPYDNDVFDLVIANDQLEVVASLEQTLNELNRVLKPDGLLVLQTIFSHELKATREDAGLESKERRDVTCEKKLRRRLFGTDIVHRLSRQLNNNVLNFSQLSPSGNLHALDMQDPFMLFRKKLSIGDSSLEPDAEFLDKRIMVSVLCVTYNQSAFVAQTLASFLEQKTNFRFEIVIGDDCSTDGTLIILRSLASRYPDVIKLLSDGPNMGPHQNWKRTYEACSGRYIAMCDGDDRWTDPLKLQKQFDYLEAHTNCALTFGNVQAHKNGCVEYNYIGGAKMDLSSEILQHAPPINTMTVMFRNVLGEMPPEMFACGAGDLFIWSLLGQHGYGHYMSEILPSIYNQHPGGVHSLALPTIQLRFRMKTFYAAYSYYSRIGRPELAKYFLQGVVKDATNIANISSPEQSQSLLGNMVSEMSNAMRNLQRFDTATLSSIIDLVQAQTK